MSDNTYRIVMSIIVAFVLAMLVDCTTGVTRFYRCTVTNHRYVPESTSTCTDSDGHVSTSTSPEEFHLDCQIVNGAGSFDVNTARSRYNSMQDGALVWVKAREGRWTGGAYFTTIVDQPPAPEQ